MLDVNSRLLLLSAEKKSWKQPSLHGSVFDRAYKKSFGAAWDNVWKKHNYTCYFCGFRSRKFQEIHHLDGDHANNKESNLVTICPLCHLSFHLDTVSLSDGGKIIWLPEFSQQELNYLLRSIFVVISQQKKMENEDIIVPEDLAFIKVARVLEGALLERSIIVEQNFQSGASDPIMFANALLSLNEKDYKNRENFISNFKLLSFSSRFEVQSKYWAKEAFKDMKVENWAKLFGLN